MFGAHLSLRVYFVYRRQFVQKFEFWFSLSDKNDIEGFIIALIFFSLLIHVKKVVRRGVLGVAHRTKVAQHIRPTSKKNFNLNVFPKILSLKVYLVYRRQFVQKFEFWFSLSDKSDSEGFIVFIFFSLLIHVIISAAWGGGRSPPHQSRTAYFF
jgi:hypothetical protein